jgi:hypothetical protein
MAAHYQEQFTEALLSRSFAMPEGVTCCSGEAPVKRFAIYRNNVSTGLARALAIRFPIAEKIVGESFFAAMAREFVRTNPPRSPVLLRYGDDFDRFVAGFAPAQSVPYLADVVRLENAQVRAYHAADEAPLEPQSLSDLEPDVLQRVKLRLHPSVSVVRSKHPIVTMWSMNSGETALGPINEWLGEDALVMRPQLSVITRRLPPGGASFLESLASDTMLGAAAERAWEEAEDFDPAANLVAALSAGVFVSLATSDC